MNGWGGHGMARTLYGEAKNLASRLDAHGLANSGAGSE